MPTSDKRLLPPGRPPGLPSPPRRMGWDAWGPAVRQAHAQPPAMHRRPGRSTPPPPQTAAVQAQAACEAESGPEERLTVIVRHKGCEHATGNLSSGTTGSSCAAGTVARLRVSEGWDAARGQPRGAAGGRAVGVLCLCGTETEQGPSWSSCTRPKLPDQPPPPGAKPGALPSGSEPRAAQRVRKSAGRHASRTRGAGRRSAAGKAVLKTGHLCYIRH